MAAGKSLVSGRGAMAYRETKQAYLPKFTPAKNPFTVPAQPESSNAPLENPAPLVEKVSTSIWARTQKPPALPSPAKSLATWTARLNPMVMLNSPHEAGGKLSRPPVQAELSLDAVKVVHNDLTDADVEIVPIKSRPAKIVPDLPAARKSWEILGEQLLKATAL